MYCFNSDPFGWGECDREKTDEDGRKYYGHDEEESGTTTWYDESGTCDCNTDTPDDDDDDW